MGKVRFKCPKCKSANSLILTIPDGENYATVSCKNCDFTELKDKIVRNE